MELEKSLPEILKKLGINQLNEMQTNTHLAIESADNTLLLSPTGSGKTLAFLLPIMMSIDPNNIAVQAIIVTPSRELAIQIEQVAREIGSGLKINAVYGGQRISKDIQHLAHKPHILIGTPGRLADHLRRDSFDRMKVQNIILDEFDKSLEIGFEKEMTEIFELLPNLSKKVLTSATKGIEIPAFIDFPNAVELNFLDQQASGLQIKKIVSPDKDKLETLVKSLIHLQGQSGIIFANFKDSIARISNFLDIHEIDHGVFYGGLEQQDRERALIKFRNGTHRLLLATDLAARGLDIDEINFIIHYHLPLRGEEFTHRNGRTARMHKDGVAYVITWENEKLPDFIPHLEEEILSSGNKIKTPTWKTLFVSGGRQDKISKGDLAGFFYKEGGLNPQQLGNIELKTDCAFVAVHNKAAASMIKKLNNRKLKQRKLRIYEI